MWVFRSFPGVCLPLVEPLCNYSNSLEPRVLNCHGSFLHLNSLGNCCDAKVKLLRAMKMTKTCRRWCRCRGVRSRWWSAKLMDSPSEAADEEPAAASVSADSALRGEKHTQTRRTCVVPDSPRVQLLPRSAPGGQITANVEGKEGFSVMTL